VSAEEILSYHEGSKHHFHRYAPSPGGMDWANQPDPFRVFEGAPVFELPLLETEPEGGHTRLYGDTRAGPRPLNRRSLAGFLELAMGLSAWKAYGSSRWALRINPSSGNLHPTESYVVVPETGTLPAGIYHYRPLDHALEQRAALDGNGEERLRKRAGEDGFLVGLTSLFWREAWKYGERAFRYCQHDVGHAVAAMRFSAELFGWRLQVLDRLSDDQVARVLGLDRTRWLPEEAEHPELLGLVSAGPGLQGGATDLPETLVTALGSLPLSGNPRPLSRHPRSWPAIHRVAKLTTKPRTPQEGNGFDGGRELEETRSPSSLSASRIIRRRRSATAFDPEGTMETPAFWSLMDRCLPRAGKAPFDAVAGEPLVHMAVFVHRVQGLSPGLYLLLRNPGHREELGACCRDRFAWEPVREAFPLYFLAPGDLRVTAAQVSCHQDIAGFSTFSLGMIARFDPVIQGAPHRYRHLFRETGMIGQVLYLEAEARGYRGTGIGCFFDDPVHELLGLKDRTYQSLYHFTVGVPVEDPRLQTHPPYGHRKADTGAP
jgi:SagB-type dehydrogenase family enzyme